MYLDGNHSQGGGTLPPILNLVLCCGHPKAMADICITTYVINFFRFSKMYDDRVEVYRMEKKKTEKLLTDLLPRQILRQMKRGQVNIINWT